ANEGKIVVIDGWNFEKPSTKAGVAALKAIGVADANVLVVIDREDEAAFLSFRNLPEVQVMMVGELNTYDVLNNESIVVTKATLPGAEAVAETVEAPEAQQPEAGE